MNEPNTLQEMLKGYREAFFYTMALSCLINILMLTIPIYMLQVFDRVIPSQSYDTLIYLTLIAIIVIGVLSMLDIARSLIMTRVGSWLDNQLSPIALTKSVDHTLLGGNYGAQSLADITTLRQFLSSSGIYAFFDAPWIVVYLTVIFLLYIPLGLLSTVGAVFLFLLTILNEKIAHLPLQKANILYLQNQESIQNSLKYAEAIQAMGMLDSIVTTWFKKNERVLSLQTEASDRSGVVLSISKSSRMVLQILILGVGAYYVVQGEITSGAMLAASIILSRALAPIEQSIGVWKQALTALQVYKRLKRYMDAPSTRQESISLPTPKGYIDVESVLYIPDGTKKPVLQNIQFSLPAGASLAVVGPSGSGKSTLARLLVGIWLPNHGCIRLDGANIYEWLRKDIGRFIGYLPQNSMLFSGSIKENIARMGDLDEQRIVAAAKFVEAHEMILHLEHGYDTEIQAYRLSGGQRQMIGLARTFYGLPKFVVLDEPESSLDEQGISALDIALKRAKAAGITVVMVTQRPDCIAFCEQVLVLNHGQIVSMGPTAS